VVAVIRSGLVCRARLVFGAMLAALAVSALMLGGCVVEEDPVDPNNPVVPPGGGGAGSSQTDPIIFTGTSGSNNGSFTESRQAMWYSFTADGRYTLTVRDNYYTPTNATTSPYTVNVKVSVLDANLDFVSDINNRAMNAVDIGSNNSADVILTDLTGVFFVKIEPYYTGSTGSFYVGLANDGPVTIGAGKADAIDITDSSPTAYELELTSSRPARWFKFTADGRYTLTVRDNYYTPTSATTSPYTVNVKVSVLDANLDFVSDINNRAMNAVDIGGNNSADVILTDLTGVYYVKIDSYYENSFGSFYIAVANTGPVTIGAGQADAIDITESSPVAYELELTSSRPARWFKFTADGRYTLTLRDNYYTPSTATTSPYTVNAKVTVLDANLDFVSDINNRSLHALDIGGNDNADIILTDLTGVYYVKIDPYYENSFGSFYVALANTGSVTAGAGQDDAIPLVIGAPRVRDELTSSRPARWFTFTADGRVNLTVYDNYYTPGGLTEEQPTVNVKVTVLDANLNFVSDSNNRQMNGVDIGNNNQSPVIFNNLSGVYYVKIDPYYENSTGFFYIGVN